MTPVLVWTDVPLMYHMTVALRFRLRVKVRAVPASFAGSAAGVRSVMDNGLLFTVIVTVSLATPPYPSLELKYHT